MHAVGEGRGGGGEVGEVDGELVWGGGVGDEDTVGADGFEEGEFVEADGFVVLRVLARGIERHGRTELT